MWYRLFQFLLGINSNYSRTHGVKMDEEKGTPSLDVAPVTHAHWNEFSDYTGTCNAECTRCGLLWWIEEGTAEENEMFYCPKCGAKMSEVEE